MLGSPMILGLATARTVWELLGASVNVKPPLLASVVARLGALVTTMALSVTVFVPLPTCEAPPCTTLQLPVTWAVFVLVPFSASSTRSLPPLSWPMTLLIRVKEAVVAPPSVTELP